MADDLAKLRAELNIGAIETPQFIKAIQAAYQNMPGADVAQAGLAMGSDALGGLLGNVYGVGKQIATGQLGTPQGTQYAFNEAQKLANQMHYTPPTQAGKDIYEGVNKLPQVVTGSHMGVGPLPELWNANLRFTPDDLSVLAKTGIEDARNFSMDYANAKAGLQREYPTMGSRAAGFTETAGDVARPLAEKAYDMYMNPQSSVEVYGMRPGANLGDLATAGGPMFAVKPKGGNWPTNLGSTMPLSEQGDVGRYLSNVQISNPVMGFEAQFQTYSPRYSDVVILEKDWKDYLEGYLSVHANGAKYADENGAPMLQLKKEAADKFAENYNLQAQAEGKKPIYTASEIENIAPPYNAWVMGPHQKYIQNQMATGVGTDPILKAVDEANIPLEGILLGAQPLSELAQSNVEDRRNLFRERYEMSGVDMADPAYANIGKQTAVTPAGQRVEAALDREMYPHTLRWSPYDQTDKYPQSSRLPNNAVVTS